MNDPLTLVIVITTVALAPFLFFTVIRYIRTDYIMVYKRFKKPVQTTGVIEWVECVSDTQGESRYIITYSYIDNRGERRTAAFRWHQRIGWRGDGIAMYFDSQAPEKCIAYCQLEYGRKIWRNTYLTLLGIVVFTLFGFLFFSK